MKNKCWRFNNAFKALRLLSPFLISFLLSLYYFLNVPGMLLTKGLCTAGFLCLEHNSSRYPCSWLPQFLPCHCSKDLSQTDLKPFKPILSPSWCGSVDWVPACKPKGCLFNSQSGHRPGLWARSPVGGMWEATTHWTSLSLSLFSLSPFLSPLPPLSKNK